MDRKRLRGKQPGGYGGPALAPSAPPTGPVVPPTAAPAELPESAPAGHSESPFAHALRASTGHAPLDVGVLCVALAGNGFQHLSDLGGLSAVDLQDLVPAFAVHSHGFINHFLSHCQCHADRESASQARKRSSIEADREAMPSAAHGVGATQDTQPAGAAGGADRDARGHAALVVLGQARRVQTVPAPDVLAAALVAASQCSSFPGVEPSGTPREEANKSRREAGFGDHLNLHVLWVEFAGWRRSAPQYASAVRLWGEAAGAISVPEWPPSEAVLDVYVGLFRNGNTLQKYLSHIRSVLHLLKAPLGVMADTQRLARGAEKITQDIFRREKIRATAEDTRRIRKWCCESGYPLLGASWAIARQFCLRYSELLNLGQSDVSFRFSGGDRKTCVVRFAHRKCYNEPCETTRRCICHLQGRTLCGVCSLFSLGEQAPVPFANARYSDALAVLKLAASALHLRNAPAWGTHAFRRGFADEALQQGGPAALFFSGGWKGVAAFGHVSAQSRGALTAAEWLVVHSDSTGDEQP